MDDASGHYTTGFLYGNNYWTGSLSLCNAIGKEESGKTIKYKNNKETNNILKNISEETISAKKSGLSFGRDQMNIGTTVIKREISPFKPGFFVLRILVNETQIALIVSSFIVRQQEKIIIFFNLAPNNLCRFLFTINMFN